MALLIQENLMKLGGVILSGQVKKIEISEAATIENIEDDKGATKANQPTGYEGAKITVDFILEDSKTVSQLEQIIALQRLFKQKGQKKAKLLKVYNEDCAARGISKVYFKSLKSGNVISESRRTATLELLAPAIAGIKLKTKKQAKKVTKTTNKALKSNSKTKKSKNKSPINKKKSTAKAKSKAKKLTK